MRQKLLKLLILGFAISGAALLGYLRVRERAAAARVEPEEVRPVAVAAEMVERGSILQWVWGEGVARAVRRRCLWFETSGRVVHLAQDAEGGPLREGSPVRGPAQGAHHGQLLALLDTDHQAQDVRLCEADMASTANQVAAAEAVRAQARVARESSLREYERVAALRAEQACSQQMYDAAVTDRDSAASALKGVESDLAAARAQVEAAQARLEQAKLAVEDGAIFAPFDGVVAHLNVMEGDYFVQESLDASTEAALLASSPIVVVDPSVFEITVDLPVCDGGQVREGQEAKVLVRHGEVSPEATEGEWIPARVYSVSPAVSPGSRMMRVRVRTLHEHARLRDGEFVEVKIAAREDEHALLVPFAALLFEGSAPCVFEVLREDGTVVRRPVSVGIQEGGQVAITDGPAEGAWVVTEGRHRLSDGARVRVVNDERSG